MPTSRGWICALIGAAAIVLGFYFDPVELYVIGATLIALVAIAWLLAVIRPLRLAVGRVVTPSRLHVGSAARVELAIRNGQYTTPVLSMTDHVQGTSGAQLLVAPLEGNGVARAAYRLPTERRGLVSLGPVDFEATDAFGLVRRTFTAHQRSQLVVFPEVIPIPPAPPSPASERRSSSNQQQYVGGASEEFHALRMYVPGDDIRRINWAASARHDDLVVREDETPTQNHLTVLLDNRSLAESKALDRGASVAASLITSMRNRSDPFRLITIDGHDTGYVLGPSGIDQALSILAIVDAASARDSANLSIQHAQGAVIVVTGEAATVGRSALGQYSRFMKISLQRSVWDPSVKPRPSESDVVGDQIHISLGAITDLANQWLRAVTTMMAARS